MAYVKHKVLVIEDDDGIRLGVQRYLQQSGYRVEAARCCSSAKRRFESFGPDAIVTDFKLPDGEALELIGDFREKRASVPIFVLTGYGSIDLAVRVLKRGADNFLTKPIDLPRLSRELKQALSAERPREPKRTAPCAPSPFLGDSAVMREFRAQAERLSRIDCSTLVLGETGTGKTMLARWLHAQGARAQAPFVELNSAGLSRELVESELFGHERGAFTSAHSAKAGLFELADGGTLFLDEIGDVDLSVQPKLLKAIEEKRFRRMGGTRERSVDLRLVAATHRDLLAAASRGAFRADLYYRLGTVTIEVPPLRARGEDVLTLARAIAAETCTRLGRGEVRLAEDAETLLLSHPWPGNVRELKNVLERALHMREGDTLEARDLQLTSVQSTAPPPATLAQLERQHIEQALRTHGKVEAAARSLGIPRSTMYQKLKTYGISSVRSSTPAGPQQEP